MTDESINDADEKEEFDNLRSKKSASSWGGTRFLPQGTLYRMAYLFEKRRE